MAKARALDPGQAIMALSALLSRVAADPSIHAEYHGLNDALSRQSRLASLCLPDAGIFSVGALNTFKRVADEAMSEQGGFTHLDALRRAALTSIERYCAKANQPKLSSRDQLRFQLSKAKAQNLVLREDLAFMTERLNAALNLAQRCAMSGDSLTQATFKRQRTEILLSLGLRKLSTAEDDSGDD